MKRFATRTITVLSLVAALGFSVPGTAYGDSSTPAANSAVAAPSPWTTWNTRWVSYFDGLKSINLSYRSSVESARSVYVSAIAAATTEAQRQSARTNFEGALAADISVRVVAITAAGDPPAPPTGYNGTAYVIGIQSANVAFRASASAAQSTYAQALASATTNTQRRTARLTLEKAIGNAIVARSTVLLALGPPPAQPGQPSS